MNESIDHGTAFICFIWGSVEVSGRETIRVPVLRGEHLNEINEFSVTMIVCEGGV